MGEAEMRKFRISPLVRIRTAAEAEKADAVNQRPYHPGEVDRVSLDNFACGLAVADCFLQYPESPFGYFGTLGIKLGRLPSGAEHHFEMCPMPGGKPHIGCAHGVQLVQVSA